MKPASILSAHLRSRFTVADGCWLWAGLTYPDGYGKYTGRPAHRVVYERLVGPVDRSLDLDHLCRVITCVNPAHLEPVTRHENMRRRAELQTHCGQGHEFDEANTYRPLGTTQRACRRCNSAAQLRYQQRKRVTR